MFDLRDFDNIDDAVMQVKREPVEPSELLHWRSSPNRQTRYCESWGGARKLG